jgi:SAM-dependent methyltransferase
LARKGVPFDQTSPISEPDTTRETHWNEVYETKRPDEVSWYQATPRRSLGFIDKHASKGDRIIDVGGGASTLVDHLLDLGHERVAVLDVSAVALAVCRGRLADRAARVEWLVADVTSGPDLGQVELWHDRAVLHFLTDAADQRAYAELASRTLRPGGHLVLATFAPDGPEKCSGLPVQRHDAESLGQLLGPSFVLVEEGREIHVTPTGREQRFFWSVFRRA